MKLSRRALIFLLPPIFFLLGWFGHEEIGFALVKNISGINGIAVVSEGDASMAWQQIFLQQLSTAASFGLWGLGVMIGMLVLRNHESAFIWCAAIFLISLAGALGCFFYKRWLYESLSSMGARTGLNINSSILLQQLATYEIGVCAAISLGICVGLFWIFRNRQKTCSRVTV